MNTLASAIATGLNKQAGIMDILKGQKDSYVAMRSHDEGIGQFLATSELFKQRVNAGANGGMLAGLVGAIVGGIAGLGLGAMIGDPLMTALVGALTGSGVGFLAGNAAGQTGVDKAYLHERGLTASVPLPVRPLALPFVLGAALPIGSHISNKPFSTAPATRLGDNHGLH
jgi:hypothetical protein